MRKIIAAIMLVVLCTTLLSCSKNEEKGKYATYTNAQYGVSLKFPSEWKPDKSYVPTKFVGDDGYFMIGAVGGNQNGIDEVTGWNAYHKLKPYGSAPTIENLTIDGQEARLLLPSQDQPAEMKEQAGLIIRYPNPITINKVTYNYLELWADKDHIRSIGETIKFIR